MFFKIFDLVDPEFDRKLVNKFVLIIKSNNTTRKVDEAKTDLYKMMKKVVIKNVKNYMKLAKNSKVTNRCHEEDEMYGEAFILLLKCVSNFKVNKKNCFYFYYNKSLSRTFYRMFSNEIRVDENSINYISEKIGVNRNSNPYPEDVYSLNLVIDFLNLNDFDREIIQSKLSYEKKDDFLKRKGNISSKLYQQSIKKIKQELNNLIENGEL